MLLSGLMKNYVESRDWKFHRYRVIIKIGQNFSLLVPSRRLKIEIENLRKSESNLGLLSGKVGILNNTLVIENKLLYPVSIISM